VRLIVGRVNLGEKIAQLARVALGDVSRMDPKARHGFAYRALKNAADRDQEAEEAPADDAAFEGAGWGARRSGARRPKEIIKEGLSEYFIYTIEGTETIPNRWSKRLRSLEGTTVPFKIQYRYRPAEYGDQLVRMYLLTNDKDSKLGTTPLPDGMVRVFRRNGHDGLSYLVAQPTKYVPIGDKIELNLGHDPRVVFELVKLRCRRDDIWVQIHGSDVFKKVGEPKVEIEVRSSVAGWDDHVLFAQRVRNCTAQPIDLEIRRAFAGHVVFRSALAAQNHDYQTVQYTATVKPAEKADLLYEILQHQGHNAKQSNVTIERAPVK